MRVCLAGRHAPALLRMVAVLLGAMTFSAASSAANLYVTTTGNNAGNCQTLGAPCLTIAYALSQAAAGDTITIVRDDGSYNHYRIMLSSTVQIWDMAGPGAFVAEFDGKGLKEPDGSAKVAYQQYPLPPATADTVDPPPPRPASTVSPSPPPSPAPNTAVAQRRMFVCASVSASSTAPPGRCWPG